jgi:hypothetical protein
MDALEKISALGGSDLYSAGTHKFLTSDIATLTLTGASGTATITANGLAAVATWATDLETTAQNFVVTNYDAYAAIGVIMTQSGNTIIFTVTAKNKLATVTIANLTTDLAGTVVKTKSGGSDVATFTLTSATSHAGTTALITVNGLSKKATFDTSIEITSTAFVAANAAAYLQQGITLTGTITLVFTTDTATNITNASIQTLHSDLTGTIARTKTRLESPIYAIEVASEAVVTSYKYINDNGFVVPGFRKFMGATLAVGAPIIMFKYPVSEIVIASGTLILHHIK